MFLDEQINILKKGAVEIIREEDLRAKLEKSNNGEKVTNANADVEISDEGILLQIGKRKFLRVTST